jgi:hypothetical protein
MPRMGFFQFDAGEEAAVVCIAAVLVGPPAMVA